MLGAAAWAGRVGEAHTQSGHRARAPSLRTSVNSRAGGPCHRYQRQLACTCAMVLSVVAAAVEEEDPSLIKQPRAVQLHRFVGGVAVAAACPALLGARLNHNHSPKAVWTVVNIW